MALPARMGQEPEAPPSDAEVVRRVVAGERALFELLLRRYNQRVYRVVRAILRREADVEDAMQQAWLQAWRHLPQLGDGQALAGWLVRIAANEALGRRRRQEPLDPYPEDDMEATGAVNPERQAAAREQVLALEEAIDRLPDTQRAAFMLRDVEGLDNTEAAAALGVSTGTFKVRLHRAHQSLQAELSAAPQAARETFRFEAPRCDPMVAWVMSRIAGEP